MKCSNEVFMPPNLKKEKIIIPDTLCASTPKDVSSSFHDYYKVNNNWMDCPEINHLEMLKSFYGEYFVDDIPDFELIKRNVLTQKNAKELFKSLFKLPYITDQSIDSDKLEKIVCKFGSQIVAHGVEEMKGGMYNLLLMSICNRALVPTEHWGYLVKGNPNISPLPHGPYFLIYSSPLSKQKKWPHYPSLENIPFILVPFEENRQILNDKLTDMATVKLITEETKAAFIQKIKTYDEFLNELTNCVTINKMPTTQPALIYGSSSLTLTEMNQKPNVEKPPIYGLPNLTLFCSSTNQPTTVECNEIGLARGLSPKKQ